VILQTFVEDAAPMAKNGQTVVVRSRPGILAGLLGCAFAVLGILTFGFVFVPLAAVCSFIGFVRGVGGLSVAGIGVSVLGCILTVVGFAVSPTLWVLLAVGAATH
jgi:hypothetical protein